MRCVENDDHEWHQVPPAVQELLIAKARRLSGWPAEGAALSLRKKNYLTLAKSCLERETGIEPATLCLGSRCSTAELLPPFSYLTRANPRGEADGRQIVYRVEL